MSNISSANRGDTSRTLEEEGTGFVAAQPSSEGWCSILIGEIDFQELEGTKAIFTGFWLFLVFEDLSSVIAPF